jgi:hypothetical protein
MQIRSARMILRIARLVLFIDAVPVDQRAQGLEGEPRRVRPSGTGKSHCEQRIDPSSDDNDQAWHSVNLSQDSRERRRSRSPRPCLERRATFSLVTGHQFVHPRSRHPVGGCHLSRPAASTTTAVITKRALDTGRTSATRPPCLGGSVRDVLGHKPSPAPADGQLLDAARHKMPANRFS